MAGEALEKAIREIKKYAGKSLQDAYFMDIYPKVERNPEDVRFTEQLRLSNYSLKLLEYAQAKVKEAFEKDGIKWPGLVWEEYVNEKIQQPEFIYCTVWKQSDSDNAGQKELPPPGINLDKLIPKAGVSAATLVIGSIGKVAGGKVAVISTAGTVLMIVGAAGLVCSLWVGVTGSGMGKAEDVEVEENSAQVDLKGLLEGQVKINMKVVDKWINELAEYARLAEDTAEKA